MHEITVTDAELALILAGLRSQHRAYKMALNQSTSPVMIDLNTRLRDSSEELYNRLSAHTGFSEIRSQ